MLKKSFKIKIIIPTVIVLVALVVVLNAFLSVRFSALSDYLINEKLITNINSLKSYLTDSRADSKAAAVSVAVNPLIVQAVEERNRDRLLYLLASAHDLYRVDFFTVCDSSGTVLVRTHEPENFGDSIINQQNIRNALNGKVSSYFESGTAVKVSIRTGAPIYDAGGALIGVVSTGTRFDTDRKAEELKNMFNVEVAVFLGNTMIATTIGNSGHRADGTVLDPDISEIVFEKRREYLDDASILGEKYKAFYMPLFNADDEVFAAIFLGIPETEIIKALDQSIIDGIILGLCGLAISVVLLFFIISSISKPITKLSDDMNHIANGNLRIEISTKSEDEVGNLGKSLQKVADILHKLLEDINDMIVEQTMGNTEYSLDTADFFGDYKILAENILELASVSMTDQMTGIPNRRSFDNRIDLEWKRAIREKQSISFMIIDVDKFKNYNDTFGHQQGDVALQTVAMTVNQSAKRSIDFAARWGGEEFVVLLPATDSDGAICVAEKIRERIESVSIPCADPRGMKVTVSIGVNTQKPMPDSSMESFVSIADAALYKAKETGRNRVVFGGGGDA